MSEFLIFNDNDKCKMKFSLDTKTFELKQVISQRLNLTDITKFNIFLEKTGFIDINPTLLNNSLSYFNPYLSNSSPPYYIFCFDKTKPYNIFQNNNLCSNKLILDNTNSESNNLSQIGIQIKQKDNLLVCLSCAKHCHNISVDYLQPDELVTDKKFKCQCDNKFCKFSNFNIDKIIPTQNEKNAFVTNCISLISKKKEDLDNFKKKQKMMELTQKILKRDFDFMEIINLFEERLQSYKDPEMQKKIKEIIPQRPPGSTSEVYVKMLLKWFKKEFFSWCNKPKCPTCGQNDKNYKVLSYRDKPNEEEKKFLAYRTERYFCNNCNKEVRFVRYNKTIKLLETRTGRCSEWSNLFGGILYTCGFKTRLINNFEDHVWNEFYNEEEKRWIHIDSCEEAYDTPLVYEQGWGRVMTFILGMSDDGLVEVTPRYVKDWKIVNERRSEKMIIKLQKIMEDVNRKMENGVSVEEKKKREERRKNEIESFENKIRLAVSGEKNENDKVNDSEKLGRQSGSLEWRKNRGEI